MSAPGAAGVADACAQAGMTVVLTDASQARDVDVLYEARCEDALRIPAFGADRAQNPVPNSERGTVASTCCW
jgi:hypothetical protein